MIIIIIGRVSSIAFAAFSYVRPGLASVMIGISFEMYMYKSALTQAKYAAVFLNF